MEALVRRMGREGAGATFRLATRSDSEAAHTLQQLGYITVTDYFPAGERAPWTVYDVRSTRKLVDAVAATQAAREAYRDEFQQVGMFGARRNTNSWEDPQRPGSETQSIIFDAQRWTLVEARAWLRRHAYDGLEPERTQNTIRFTQHRPDLFRPDSFRTIPLGDNTGIQATVAIPRK